MDCTVVVCLCDLIVFRHDDEKEHFMMLCHFSIYKMHSTRHASPSFVGRKRYMQIVLLWKIHGSIIFVPTLQSSFVAGWRFGQLVIFSCCKNLHARANFPNVPLFCAFRWAKYFHFVSVLPSSYTLRASDSPLTTTAEGRRSSTPLMVKQDNENFTTSVGLPWVRVTRCFHSRLLVHIFFVLL